MAEVKSPLFSLSAHGSLGPFRFSNLLGHNYVHLKGIYTGAPAGIGFVLMMGLFAVAAYHWRDEWPEHQDLWTFLSHRRRKMHTNTTPKSHWTPYNQYMSERLKLGEPGADPLTWEAHRDQLRRRYLPSP